MPEQQGSLFFEPPMGSDGDVYRQSRTPGGREHPADDAFWLVYRPPKRDSREPATCREELGAVDRLYLAVFRRGWDEGRAAR